MRDFNRMRTSDPTMPVNRATLTQEPAKAAEQGITLTLPGAPRTKKNRGKIWKAGKRTIIMPAQPWMDWRDSLVRWQVETRFHPTHLGFDYDLNCCALFYRDARRGDAVGYYQGLADVLEELCVVYNDRAITQWDGSRMLVDKANPRVELVLTPVTRPLGAA